MKVLNCRGCGSEDLQIIHDFGFQPLAGDYPEIPDSKQPVKRYALDLSQCGCCGLLQVTNLPPIYEVFHEDYRYSSSTVPGLVRHFAGYAEWLTDVLPRGAKIFEFGCNDGVLLEMLQPVGFFCAGIDASDNVATLARAKGLEVATGFLSTNFVRSRGYLAQFDLVTCSNVLAHIHNLAETLEAVRLLLADGGFFAIEVHDGDLLCTEGQFDTVYHEHLTYFTEESLRQVLARNGFEFIRCERTAMHGGGLRMLARRLAGPLGPAKPLKLPVPLEDFITPAVEKCKSRLINLHQIHGPLSGYGAAGRAQMFINFTETGNLFDRVFDDSAFRQGRYIAGTDIPITSFNNHEGECMIILAWNYAADIADKVRGKFRKIITMLPEERIW